MVTRCVHVGIINIVRYAQRLTGIWRGTHAIAARFPDAFLQNSVGTTYLL